MIVFAWGVSDQDFPGSECLYSHDTEHWIWDVLPPWDRPWMGEDCDGFGFPFAMSYVRNLALPSHLGFVHDTLTLEGLNATYSVLRDRAAQRFARLALWLGERGIECPAAQILIMPIDEEEVCRQVRAQR